MLSNLGKFVLVLAILGEWSCVNGKQAEQVSKTRLRVSHQPHKARKTNQRPEGRIAGADFWNDYDVESSNIVESTNEVVDDKRKKLGIRAVKDLIMKGLGNSIPMSDLHSCNGESNCASSLSKKSVKTDPNKEMMFKNNKIYHQNCLENNKPDLDIATALLFHLLNDNPLSVVKHPVDPIGGIIRNNMLRLLDIAAKTPSLTDNVCTGKALDVNGLHSEESTQSPEVLNGLEQSEKLNIENLNGGKTLLKEIDQNKITSKDPMNPPLTYSNTHLSTMTDQIKNSQPRTGTEKSPMLEKILSDIERNKWKPEEHTLSVELKKEPNFALPPWLDHYIKKPVSVVRWEKLAEQGRRNSFIDFPPGHFHVNTNYHNKVTEKQPQDSNSQDDGSHEFKCPIHQIPTGHHHNHESCANHVCHDETLRHSHCGVTCPSETTTDCIQKDSQTLDDNTERFSLISKVLKTLNDFNNPQDNKIILVKKMLPPASLSTTRSEQEKVKPRYTINLMAPFEFEGISHLKKGSKSQGSSNVSPEANILTFSIGKNKEKGLSNLEPSSISLKKTSKTPCQEYLKNILKSGDLEVNGIIKQSADLGGNSESNNVETNKEALKELENELRSLLKIREHAKESSLRQESPGHVESSDQSESSPAFYESEENVGISKSREQDGILKHPQDDSRLRPLLEMNMSNFKKPLGQTEKSDEANLVQPRKGSSAYDELFKMHGRRITPYVVTTMKGEKSWLSSRR